MADQIVIEYTANVNKLQAELKKAEESQTHLAKGAVATSATITKSSDKAATGVQKVTKQTHGLRDAFQNLSGNLPFAGAIQQVTQLGGSMGGAVAGVQMMGTAWTALDLIFKRSIIGLIVTAIIGLITAVTTFFRVSEEGGDKLAKIMSVVGTVVSKVTGVFSELGRVVVNVFEYAFEKVTQFYDFMVDTFLTGLTNVASGLRSIGFDAAANKIDGATASIKKAREESEAWAKQMVKLGQDIADIEDKIETKTLDIALANSKLQTQIETTLKALKNTTNTYQENVDLIKKIEVADNARFKNNISLIGDEIQAERLKFQKRSVNEAQALVNFNAFVNGQINATELANRVDGENRAEHIKGITEILLKREEANKETELIETRLNNLREQYLHKNLASEDKRHKAHIANLNLEAKTEIGKTELSKEEQKKRDKFKHDSFANFKAVSEAEKAQNVKDQEAITAKNLEESNKRKAIRAAALSETIELSSNLLNGVNDLELARTTAAIDQERTANKKKEDEQLKNLEKRKELGLLSERQFETEKQRIAVQSAKKEAALKRKQYEAEKKANINRVLIETAVAIAKAVAASPVTFGLPFSAFAAANGALQIALINSRPTPQFKDGVIDFKGKGTQTSDSNTVQISNRESVIKAKQSIKYKSALTAINNDNFDDYINRNHIIPYVKSQEKAQRTSRNNRESASEAMLKALALNGLVDTSHLERLTKKNKSVKMENTNELAEALGRVIKSKQGRGI